MGEAEMNEEYWASVRQHHDEFVELATRELQADALCHPVAPPQTVLLEDAPAHDEDAVYVRQFS